MIGKKIRNISQLNKMITNKEYVDVVIRTYNTYQFCRAVSYGDKSVVFFGNCFNNDDYSDILGIYVPSVCQTYKSHFVCRRIVDLINMGFDEIIAFDFDLVSTFNKFLCDNKKTIGDKLTKYGISNHYLSYIMYAISYGSSNYFSWIIKQHMENNIPLSVLNNIMVFTNKYHNELKKLSKGTITAYNSRHDIINLLSEIEVLKRNKRCNEAMNKFNTMQKKMLKSIELNENEKKNLSKFLRLSNEKQRNFIRKVSTFESHDAILKHMAYAVKDSFKWSRESVLEAINNTDNINYNIIFDNNNVLVIEAFDYETIKLLGKTTNWCISKNKKYWDNYMINPNQDRQFVLFNFNQKEDTEYSIIGFTMRNSKIIHAHSFTNNNIKGNKGGVNEFSKPIKVFGKSNSFNGIHSILKSCGITLQLFKHPLNDKIDDVLQKLDTYKILARTNEWVVLEMDTYNLKLFGFKNLSINGNWMVFMRIANEYIEDVFSVIIETDNKNVFNRIVLDSDSHTVSTDTFNVFLLSYLIGIDLNELYGVSMSRIAYELAQCGYYDESINFIKSFNKIQHNNNEINIMFDDYDNINYGSLVETLLLHNMSFDFIRKLYQNGVKLCDISDSSEIAYLMISILSLCGIDNDNILSDTEFREFENKPIKVRGKINNNLAKVYNYIFNQIINHETNQYFFEWMIIFIVEA